MRLLLLITTVWVCIACSGSVSQAAKSSWAPNKGNHLSLLKKTEKQAQPAGKKILAVGRHMALESKEIVRGSCWNYINTVYTRAGYPQSKRRYVLKGKKNKGPYAGTKQIRAGDWLYYINHSYHGIEHSGIFVRWINRAKRIGLILSYGGEHRKKPGRYRQYDLSHVYVIIRAKP